MSPTHELPAADKAAPLANLSPPVAHLGVDIRNAVRAPLLTPSDRTAEVDPRGSPAGTAPIITVSMDGVTSRTVRPRPSVIDRNTTKSPFLEQVAPSASVAAIVAGQETGELIHIAGVTDRNFRAETRTPHRPIHDLLGESPSPAATSLDDLIDPRERLFTSKNAHAVIVGTRLEVFHARLLSDDPADRDFLAAELSALEGNITKHTHLLAQSEHDLALADVRLQQTELRRMQLLNASHEGFLHLGQLAELRAPLLVSRSASVRAFGRRLVELEKMLDRRLGAEDATFRAEVRALVDTMDSAGLSPTEKSRAEADLRLLNDVFESGSLTAPRTWEDLDTTRIPMAASRHLAARMIVADLRSFSPAHYGMPLHMKNYPYMQARAAAIREHLREARRTEQIPDHLYMRGMHDVTFQMSHFLANAAGRPAAS